MFVIKKQIEPILDFLFPNGEQLFGKVSFERQEMASMYRAYRLIQLNQDDFKIVYAELLKDGQLFSVNIYNYSKLILMTLLLLVVLKALKPSRLVLLCSNNFVRKSDHYMKLIRVKNEKRLIVQLNVMLKALKLTKAFS